MISTRWHKASSEEAFIIALTKLAASSTNTRFVKIFGATTDTFISRVYQNTISSLDNKFCQDIWCNYRHLYLQGLPKDHFFT
ncbi:MAG: hypothetical protein ACK53Y_23640 [bacterium]|jgi:hypothetical protein